MRIVWTRRAAARLRSIFEHVAHHDPAAGARLVARIDSAVGRLASHPGLGRPGARAGTRELFISGTEYVAVYKAMGADVEVIAIFHSRQNRPTRA